MRKCPSAGGGFRRGHAAHDHRWHSGYRSRTDDSPSAPRLTAGFRALAVPEVKLGSHWYAYSAVQVRSTPFFYEDAYSADRTVKIDILQGFLGYTRSWHQ